MQAQHSTEKETTTDITHNVVQETQNCSRTEESFKFRDWEAERLLPVYQYYAENVASGPL